MSSSEELIDEDEGFQLLARIADAYRRPCDEMKTAIDSDRSWHVISESKLASAFSPDGIKYTVPVPPSRSSFDVFMYHRRSPEEDGEFSYCTIIDDSSTSIASAFLKYSEQKGVRTPTFQSFYNNAVNSYESMIMSQSPLEKLIRLLRVELKSSLSWDDLNRIQENRRQIDNISRFKRHSCTASMNQEADSKSRLSSCYGFDLFNTAMGHSRHVVHEDAEALEQAITESGDGAFSAVPRRKLDTPEIRHAKRQGRHFSLVKDLVRKVFTTPSSSSVPSPKSQRSLLTSHASIR